MVLDASRVLPNETAVSFECPYCLLLLPVLSSPNDDDKRQSYHRESSHCGVMAACACHKHTHVCGRANGSEDDHDVVHLSFFVNVCVEKRL